MIAQTARIRSLATFLGAVVMTLSLAAWADGRTDGPEGSEYGQGGYDAGVGGVYIQANFGAVVVADSATSADDTYLTGGFAIGMTRDDWVSIEAGADFFDPNNGSTVTLINIGAKFRALYDPLAFYFSLKPGITLDRIDSFRLTPGVGADLYATDHLSLGLAFDYDINFEERLSNFYRVYTTIGLRF